MNAACAIFVLASILLGAVSGDKQSYSLSVGDKKCLIADIDASITVTYATKDGNATAHIPLPSPTGKGVEVSGACARSSDEHAMMTISFLDESLTLNFTDTSGQVVLSGLEFDYKQDSVLFPNATATGMVKAVLTDNILSMGGDKKFFQCHSPIHVEIDKSVSISFSSMKVQAFNVDDGFSKEASICAQDPTATPPPVTPTPAPTAPPTPAIGNWTVKAKNNTVCIVAQMGVRLVIPYNKTDGTNGTTIVDLPKSASTNGSSCGDFGDSQVLALKFMENWVLKFVFVKEAASGSKTKNEYGVRNVSLTYFETEKLFPNSSADPKVNQTASANGLDLFRAGLGMSFICQSKQDHVLRGTGANVTMDTYGLHLQAFKYDNKTTFVGGDQPCPADVETNGIVPIAVGAALAGLVFIVVIAYIIGRKRRYQGYEAL